MSLTQLSGIVGDVLNGRAHISNPYVRRAIDYDLDIWTQSMYRVLLQRLGIDNPLLYTNDIVSTKNNLEQHLIDYMERLPQLNMQKNYIINYANQSSRHYYNTNRDHALQHISLLLANNREPLDAEEKNEFNQDFATLNENDIIRLAERENIYGEIGQGVLNKINGFPYDLRIDFDNHESHQNEAEHNLALRDLENFNVNDLDHTFKNINIDEIRSFLEREYRRSLPDETSDQLIQLYINVAYDNYLFRQLQLYNKIHNQMILRDHMSFAERSGMSVGDLSLENLRQLADEFGIVVHESNNYKTTKHAYVRAIVKYIVLLPWDRPIKIQ